MAINPGRAALLAGIALGFNQAVYSADGPGMPDEATRWIHGSYINLRQAPRNSATVVAQLPANTRVTLRAQNGSWCEVETLTRTRGFMGCKLLGAAPLTLDRLGTNDAWDAIRRAFWVAPSWDRLVDAGQALTYQLLNARQREREIQEQKPLRWAVPEFEAMKARLREGARLLAEQEFSDTVKPFDARSLAGPGLPDNALAKARPSLFKSRREVVLRPSIDQAVALGNGTMTLREVLGRPEFNSNRSDDQWIDGSWDLAAAELSLEPPVISYAVMDNGLLGATAIASAVASAGPKKGNCGSVDTGTLTTSWEAKREQALKGYPQVPADKAIVTFFSAHQLKPEQVQVRTRAFRVAATGGDGKRVINKTLVHEVDLNQDGAPDMVVMTGLTPSGISPFRTWTKVFVNINGVWSQELDETEEDCT